MPDRKTIHRAAKVRSSTFNPDDNTVDVVFTTGASVRRQDWDGEYDEVLSLEPGAVRLDRLNAGAPVLDTHDPSELSRVIGSVVKGSARIEGGKGLATVRLTTAAGAADTVTKIREGVITNISVGYWVHAAKENEVDGVRTVTAVDWEPLEISAVPIPADPGAQFRSLGRRRSAGNSRAGAIRRMARKAGVPAFGEEHVRAGTSTDDFFKTLATRLAGSTPTSAGSKTMTRKTSGDDFNKAIERGAAEAKALRTPAFRLDTPYAGIGRAADAKKTDDEDEDDDTVRDDDDADEMGADTCGDDADDKVKKDSKAGKREAESLLRRPPAVRNGARR